MSESRKGKPRSLIVLKTVKAVVCDSVLMGSKTTCSKTMWENTGRYSYLFCSSISLTNFENSL